MGLGRTFAVALVGLDGYLVEVEADISQSLPAFVLLGLPDASLNEAKDRIKSAAKNAGIPLSRRKITVNLVPASLPKKGSGFDLSILIAALQASGDVRPSGRTVFLAELGLDGRLRPVRGVLPAVMAAVRHGCADVVVAGANAAEARLVPGARIRSFATLAEVLLDFGADPGQLLLPSGGQATAELQESVPPPALPEPDMADVAGQVEARTALEIAAAGGHHMVMVGPPGAGKTMLAERLPGILPDLPDHQAMEVTAIHSLSRTVGQLTQLIRRPPFESPHHSATGAAIVGGGSGVPRPGAVSRAHRGVLFLDEAPEFDRSVLDALRQPLESGSLVIHRASGSASYPARFQLVMAANPCPCGMSGGKGLECVCSPNQRRRYLGRLSRPLVDRIDLQLTMQRISLADIAAGDAAESSSKVAARVHAARAAQRERLARWGLDVNAEAGAALLKKELKPPRQATADLDRAMDLQVLTGRGYSRVLRVAWTVADLRGLPSPDRDCVGTALAFRQQVKAA
ncbi:YifB family Mg chelatase-like AAA ATPase [Arthrobacter sp. I2-34]|uniref:YifB family Mg chelatase-like AAA ATPase n=1 Tax=Arthrobacter hankyongi TaxID=2904801 RepID=A0ABS9L6Q7_9MICC|nr:YifB family Mg chelatase-like AAA ATPase [Arthrobacter hankyongi]MCG2622311.1 YifB family Mg chelatase-like AAA ATPase [Arthrobacter hankyongi]